MKIPGINTLLLITSTRCCRADVGARGEVTALWSQPRRAGLSLAESARFALGLGVSTGRQVLVLTTEVWTQTLSLHRGQVSGLARAELEQALAFEAEPFSGLSPLDSVLGASDSGARDGSASFWVVQLARNDRDGIGRAIKDSGSKLAAIGHPGAVPLPLTSVAGGAAWRRIECWDGAWLLATCEDGRNVQTKVIPSAPNVRDLPAHGVIERLHARESAVFANDALPLSDESTLRLWFGKATLALAQNPAALPFIIADAPTSSRNVPFVIGALLTAAVLVFSVAQWFWFGAQKREQDEKRAEQAAIQPLIDAANKEIAKLNAEITDAQKKQQNLARLEQQRGALLLLMQQLAKHCSQDVVVRSIKAERGTMILGGVSLEAASVDELGIVLTSVLKPVGLVAQPQEKKARQSLANRGPWDFTIAVMPLELVTNRTAVAPVISDN